jgi:hypothetical protein
MERSLQVDLVRLDWAESFHKNRQRKTSVANLVNELEQNRDRRSQSR